MVYLCSTLNFAHCTEAFFLCGFPKKKKKKQPTLDTSRSAVDDDFVPPLTTPDAFGTADLQTLDSSMYGEIRSVSVSSNSESEVSDCLPDLVSSDSDVENSEGTADETLMTQIQTLLAYMMIMAESVPDPDPLSFNFDEIAAHLLGTVQDTDITNSNSNTTSENDLPQNE